MQSICCPCKRVSLMKVTFYGKTRLQTNSCHRMWTQIKVKNSRKIKQPLKNQLLIKLICKWFSACFFFASSFVQKWLCTTQNSSIHIENKQQLSAKYPSLLWLTMCVARQTIDCSKTNSSTADGPNKMFFIVLLNHFFFLLF